MPDDLAGDAVGVWPENWASVEFFAAISAGAWNVGFTGPIGIRPEVFPEVRLAMGTDIAAWPDMYRDLLVMEAAAIEQMRKDSQ
jgi:hypothetical protein